LDDEEHISCPPSPTDKALGLQESAPYIDYEGLLDFITTRYVTTSSDLISTRSLSPLIEKSMASFSPPRTGSRSLCDTNQDILQNLQPKALNFRIIDSEKPTLDFVCTEHNSKRTLEVLPMETDEFLAQSENFDIIILDVKSSNFLMTVTYPAEAFLHMQNPQLRTILNNDGHVNQENRKRHRKSKKKKNESSKTSVKTEDLKDKKIPQVSTNVEIKYVVRGQSVHDRTGKCLMSHNDCPKTLTV
jgi:hypothetical protein